MFIVPELVDKDFSFQISVPPVRMEAREGLGGQACTAGAAYDIVYVCAFKLEASLS